MTFTQLSFYIFSTVLILSAVMVITIRNPVKAALFLVLAFVNAACVWLTLEAEFLAIVLILVYVGAVMVLFLFVVMMLDINLDRLREGFTRYLPVGGVVAAIMIAEMVWVLKRGGEFGLANMPRPEPKGADYSNTKELGEVLYTVYVYPFEIAAIILLVAIIAAITLTLRRREGARTQRPSDQVSVRAEDRLRMVNMKSEKKSG